MGRGGNTSEALSCSGFMKILETALVFSTIMVHRYGDHGSYVFFATDARKMAPVRPLLVN